MERRVLTGNECVALGALRAGVHVVTGYPGTPSTGALLSLLEVELPGRHVEWSTNEKVALEIATGAAWAGRRALCTMKMSGINVAYDALISIAYSGTRGGLVLYVADDPGVSAGMAEQDSRGFAWMSDLPIVEPASPAEAYATTQRAFELSEAIGTPVLLRLTTAVSLTHAVVDIPSLESLAAAPPANPPSLERDIRRQTKAGARICLDQHEALLNRLDAARDAIREMRLNRLKLSRRNGGVGLVAVGAVRAYLAEALNKIGNPEVSLLEVATSIPAPTEEIRALLRHCASVLVLEELEPFVEQQVYVEAFRTGYAGTVVGKLDGTLPHSGEYGLEQLLAGLDACGFQSVAPAPGRRKNGEPIARVEAAARPITVCAGCPHRGTYLAIEAAIREAGYSKDDVMVTGDIGCTILGMNPPFEVIWNEVSMGSSVSLAQGYAWAGVDAPVIATLGDSTLFHGGLPGLINAIQHRVPMTVIVMDNGWTSMTGMQVNPGTQDAFQREGRRVDLEQVLRGLGPDRFERVDPYDLVGMTSAIHRCLQEASGVSVLLAQRECAIQARRRGLSSPPVVVNSNACVLCKRCLRMTGCPALGVAVSGRTMVIDPTLCNGCGLCMSFCPTGALTRSSDDGTSDRGRQ